MKKTLAGLFSLILIFGCSMNNEKQGYYEIVAGEDDTSYLADVEGCPKVHIRSKNKKIIQKEGRSGIFEITAVGYEGFCKYNEKLCRDQATVMPKFRIRRLSPSDVTDVHISYFLETVEGPVKYLGRKTYFASTTIPEGVNEIYFTAEGGELSIPQPGTYNLDIYLGLNADRYDMEVKN